MAKELPEEVKWRGSTYRKEKVEDGRVTWVNPYSQHRAVCSVESWLAGNPYGDSL